MSRRVVVIESPFAGRDAGAHAANVTYARQAVADALARGEAPFAAHLLYPQPLILDDDDPDERARGIAAGLAFYRVADVCAVYADRGVSAGMRAGIAEAMRREVPVDVRFLWAPAPPVAGLIGAIGPADEAPADEASAMQGER